MPDADTAVTDAGTQPEPTPPDMDDLLKQQTELQKSIDEATKFNDTLKADNFKLRERERVRTEEAAAAATAATDEQNRLLQKQGRFEELAKAKELELEVLKQREAELVKQIGEISPKVEYAERYEAMAEDRVKALQKELSEDDQTTFNNLYPDFETMTMIDKEDRLRRYIASKPAVPAGAPLGGTGNPRKQPADNAEYDAAAKRGDLMGMMKFGLGTR